jgi:hypothetical protein
MHFSSLAPLIAIIFALAPLIHISCLRPCSPSHVSGGVGSTSPFHQFGLLVALFHSFMRLVQFSDIWCGQSLHYFMAYSYLSSVVCPYMKALIRYAPPRSDMIFLMSFSFWAVTRNSRFLLKNQVLSLRPQNNPRPWSTSRSIPPRNHGWELSGGKNLKLVVVGNNVKKTRSSLRVGLFQCCLVY